MRDVAHHVRRCRLCEGFLNELRVVDALLWTARSPATVGSDFTAAVVLATRSAAPRAVRRRSFWLPLGAYLALAWVVAGFAVMRAGDLTALAAGSVLSVERALLAIEAAMRALAPATALVAAAVTAVLLLDLFLLGAMFFGYRRLRPLLALYLARGSRS
jgi:hypothetical protein